MKLTQALIPTSSGIANGMKGEKFSSSDDYDGYEIGTWDLSIYNYFCDTLKKKLSAENKETEPFAVLIYHRFSEEERKVIFQSLNNDWEKKEEKGKQGMFYKDIALLPQWHQRLVDLFSKPEDLPVYYFCD